MDRGRLTRNTFNKGRNTDQDRNKISPDQYLEAHNLEMVGDGTFYSLKNIKGTVNVGDILGLDITLVNECLGVFKTYWLINSEIKQCLTIFTLSTSNLFKIWCFDIDAQAIYEIYEESVPVGYAADDRVIDAKAYGENGVDVIYFTDNYHEVRKLICSLPSPYVPNYISDYELSLQRRGGLGSIEFAGMTIGALLSGTYQFAYRMADPLTKTFTKWSSITNPIHVYTSSDTSAQVFSGVGVPTPFGIVLNINPTTEELANFGYFQLAVIENVNATTITTVASLLPLELTANRLSYNYKANTKVGEIVIDDLVVDLAQVATVKTLNIKQNRLFLANVHYSDLSFDNGTPTITSGSVIKADNGLINPYSDQQFSTQKIGYFRDEVYRFGIVYSDKYGNKSAVQALDLSTVVDNQIASGLIDIKFPARSLNPGYSLFNSSGHIQVLGLTLTGIVNHPTWATKLEIVRAKRIENIKTQTPVIPMVTVTGIGALERYPSQSTTSSFPNATPQTASAQLVPKNLFWPETRDIIINPTSFSNNGSLKEAGEAYYNNNVTYRYAKVYPQSTLCGDTPFSFTGAEALEEIDRAVLQADITDFNVAITAGDDVNTSITGTFYATDYRQYYYDPINTRPTLLSNKIQAYEYLPNLSTGSEIAGNTVENYALLQTGGVNLGVAPDVNAGAIVQLQFGEQEHPTNFIVGTFNVRASGGNNFIVGSSGVKYSTTGTTLYNSNDYINEYPGYVNKSSYVGIVSIANIVLGLADDRYGQIQGTHEFISTGAIHTFSDSELVNVQAGSPVPITLDVWGGDCFVGAQVFKVIDSSYSLVNAPKWYTTSQTDAVMKPKWNEIFKNSGSNVISLPVAVGGASAFIEVVLESKYNGFVRDYDVLLSGATSAGIPILVIGQSNIRTPLTYKYNLNLSKQNDEKIYFPSPQYIPIQNAFKARVLYSDLKIYNTAEQGFDVFRVLNFYDLEEKRGGITKLALAADNLHAIQERGVVYLPTGQTQLEQTDGGSLSVGTANVIGRPIIVDSERGGQHLRGIVESGIIVYIPDNLNKAVYILNSAQSLTNISAETENNTLFRQIFETIIAEKNIIGIYDPVRLEYWLVDNANFTCQIFNEKYGFIGDYEFSADSKLEGGVYADQNLYLIGVGTEDTGKLAVQEMYTGPNNSLMGELVVPRVTVSVNPDEDISKVFDNMMLSASDRLDSMDLVVQHETAIGDQSTVVNLDLESIEGNFRVKTLLDVNKSRLRGPRVLATIKWGELTSNLSSLYTKYRLSRKTPF